jgi:hypothetical protein
MILIILNRVRVLKILITLRHLDEIMSSDRGYVLENFVDVGSTEKVNVL